MLDRLRHHLTDSPACDCTTTLTDSVLTVDATDCPNDGALPDAPSCRATVTTAIGTTTVEAILIHQNGREHRYDGDAARLLSRAAASAAAIAPRDPGLATRLRHQPLAAAQDALDRAGPVATTAARTGLEPLTDTDSLDAVLTPSVRPQIADTTIDLKPPDAAQLIEHRNTAPDTTVRIYTIPSAELPTYHIEPAWTSLTNPDYHVLATARSRLATGQARGGVETPPAAIDAVPRTPDAAPERLARILAKHTRGFGILADLFADDRVTDVYAPAPVDGTRLRVTVDDEAMLTNASLTSDGAAALASRLRRTSGNPFSRADPTIDAHVTVGPADTRVRATGVTDPATDGYGFAFRAHPDHAWTVPRLVATDTLTPWCGALLSIAVERGATILVAGARGAGKTTLLGALLWELPAATRVVTIEDTPELPVAGLQARNRDVQALYTTEDDFDAATALRSALRMGEGALVVGEVRGTEARVLYEAMRVGANESAVLGTIHGDRAETVRERVVADLDVPASSFAATDLVVTTAAGDDRGHHLAAIEEVTGPDPDAAAPLYEAAPTGRIARGSSDLIATLADPDETYATVRSAISDRQSFIESLVRDEHTDPGTVVDAHARRRRHA
ncbi:MAG: ATPase, T2SS/T4P/T4SS family [Halobacteriaceae archaeon]